MIITIDTDKKFYYRGVPYYPGFGTFGAGSADYLFVPHELKDAHERHGRMERGGNILIPPVEPEPDTSWLRNRWE